MSEGVNWAAPRRQSTARVVLGVTAIVGGLLAAMVFLFIGLFSSLVWVYLSIAVFVLGPLGGAVLVVMGIRAGGKRWVFNPPPGWPEPPTGWSPPPGWQPDQAWPDPPAGWQFWVTS